jgi:hypothetical protein
LGIEFFYAFSETTTDIPANKYQTYPEKPYDAKLKKRFIIPNRNKGRLITTK